VSPRSLFRTSGLLALLFLVLWGGPALPARAQAATPGVPVVHAVMFWKVGCHYCEQTLSVILPPIQEEYGGQFELRLVRVSTQEDVDNLLRLAESMGVDPHVVGVPFLVVGDHVLMGPSQIHEKLPGLIDEYLAQGGVDLPANPILIEILSAPTPTWDTYLPSGTPAAPPSGARTAEAAFQGRDLATGALVLLCAILIYSLAAVIWERIPAPSGRWGELAALVMTVSGSIVAGYLSYVDLHSIQAVCGLVGDCNAVQSSSYSHLFGVLPVALLGLGGYLSLLAAWGLGRFLPRLRWAARLASLGLAFAGTVFSLYLTYLERFVIHAVCLWCITSAVTMSLILFCSVGPSRRIEIPPVREGKGARRKAHR
jgi:uncharacterized membrane protein